MRFTIPEAILAKLRAVRADRGYTDPVIEREDAFFLYEGLGPVCYLTSDGRVLVDSSWWDGRPLYEGDDDEAYSSIVVGAKNTGIPELLSLLPAALPASRRCERCKGERWMNFGRDLNTGKPARVVCHECSGRGWRPAP